MLAWLDQTKDIKPRSTKQCEAEKFMLLSRHVPDPRRGRYLAVKYTPVELCSCRPFQQAWPIWLRQCRFAGFGDSTAGEARIHGCRWSPRTLSCRKSCGPQAARNHGRRNRPGHSDRR